MMDCFVSLRWCGGVYSAIPNPLNTQKGFYIYDASKLDTYKHAHRVKSFSAGVDVDFQLHSTAVEEEQTERKTE